MHDLFVHSPLFDASPHLTAEHNSSAGYEHGSLPLSIVQSVAGESISIFSSGLHTYAGAPLLSDAAPAEPSSPGSVGAAPHAPVSTLATPPRGGARQRETSAQGLCSQQLRAPSLPRSALAVEPLPARLPPLFFPLLSFAALGYHKVVFTRCSWCFLL